MSEFHSKTKSWELVEVFVLLFHIDTLDSDPLNEDRGSDVGVNDGFRKGGCDFRTGCRCHVERNVAGPSRENVRNDKISTDTLRTRGVRLDRRPQSRETPSSVT